MRPSLGETFRTFATRQAAGVSALYEQLAHAVAGHPGLLELAAHARAGQPAPNMLLGAVHYLVRHHPGDPLAAYYDGTIRTSDELIGATDLFARFCTRHRPEILELLATRSVQTNEVRRAAVLLPAFAMITQNTDTAIHVIDVGCSAGLTLLWPRFQYRYDVTRVVFPTSTSLELCCQPRGAVPPLEVDPHRFANLIGVEVHPIDLSDSDTRDWLDALCWPEQTDRRRLLRDAIALATRHPPRVIDADATRELPAIIEQVPTDATPCVVCCWSIYQIYGTPGGRERLVDQLADINRPVWEVSVGHFGRLTPIMILAYHHNGTHHERIIASCDVYGRWIRWHCTDQDGGLRCP
ncbi:MAG: DUF2332 domain-containing protein [Pseudonocardia sp.]